MIAGVEQLLWGDIFLPPSGGNGKFIITANLGSPSGSSTVALPGNVGAFCHPLLLPGASSAAVWNNIGKTNLVGSSSYFGNPIADPAKASTVFFLQHFGDLVNFPAGTTATFQGVIVDPASASPRGVSTTNAVVLQVE